MTKPTCIYMNKYTLLSETVKSSVTMPQIVERYTAEPIQKDRIPCPFHNGKNANLWFSDTGYHCFVCGVGGDAISFVQRLFGLSFSDALRKIVEDFSLPIEIGRKQTVLEQNQMRAKQAERERIRAEQIAADEAYTARYNELLDLWVKCDIALRTKAPQNQDDEPCEEWVFAIKNIEHINFALDNISARG